MSDNRANVIPYSQYADSELANVYFNRIQYMSDSNNVKKFWDEVDRRRGSMLRSEWLDYNY